MLINKSVQNLDKITQINLIYKLKMTPKQFGNLMSLSLLQNIIGYY